MATAGARPYLYRGGFNRYPLPSHHHGYPLTHPFFSPLRSSSSSRYFRTRVSSSALKEQQGRSLNGQRRNRAEEKNQRDTMTIKPAVRISSDAKLLVNGRTVLTGVPAQVTCSSAAGSAPAEGVFLGSDFRDPSCRNVVSLGTLRGLRFMASFRFKLWWMSQKMGKLGSDVPLETQFLLLELPAAEHDSDVLYTAFLPLVEGPFRAALQGNSHDELQLCIESGDAQVTSSFFTHTLFVGAANPDPFQAITNAVQTVKHHLKTFRQRHEKRVPPIVDCFGWCTWDAFYQGVTQEGVESGLETLASGGVPPKFVIIDDGWQSVGKDLDKEDENGGDAADQKQPPLMRLTGIRENSKFQTDGANGKADTPAAGIEKIVRTAKDKYGLHYVYVWHAITGYWGGVRPGVAGMEQYGSAMKYPIISPTIADNEPGLMTDPLTLQGLGLVDPTKAFRFYDDLHAYLASAGVDGVKVDVQCILETLGAGLGGRVELTRKYHQALDASVAKNFPGNGIIACMSHNTDAIYCSKQTAVVRASDDFWPRDPVSHTVHIAAVAYNSVFLGEFMVPDWDMFHTLHPAAEYHASARAISGGPVYVSDAPGKHNFELLRKLVLPDGSILRARLPGRPTQDCLFTDPVRDGVTLLKIWNMNKFTGVLGVYNCQGAAWSSTEKKYVFHKDDQEDEQPLTCAVKGSDVHLLSEAVTDDPSGTSWNGDCALYRHGSDADLTLLPSGAALPVTLKVLEHCIFTVSPVKTLAPGLRFAPFGLIDMYNAGGAIDGISYHQLPAETTTKLGEEEHAPLLVSMEVKGCGRVGSYSSVKPTKCSVNSVELDYCYDSSSGLLVFNLDKLPEGGKRTHRVVVEY